MVPFGLQWTWNHWVGGNEKLVGGEELRRGAVLLRRGAGLLLGRGGWDDDADVRNVRTSNLKIPQTHG
jgi:hypothetical protein